MMIHFMVVSIKVESVKGVNHGKKGEMDKENFKPEVKSVKSK